MNPDTLRHWPTLIEIALALVLVVQTGRLAWMLFLPADGVEGARTPTLPAQVPALAAYDPFFGHRSVSSADFRGWRVFGVRTAEGGGSAIFGKDKGSQGAYAVGDEIVQGVVLEGVGVDHVTVSEGGVSRRLELMPANGAIAASLAVATALPSAAPRPPIAAKPSASSVDPTQLLTQAGLQAKSEAGRITGYTLMPRGNDALLRQAGLQPGDVLLSVNGQTLDPEHLPEVVGQLKNDPRAVVSFRRDGQTHTVSLGSGTP